MMLPLRKPPSAVINTFDSESLILSLSDSALKPPKTTLWGAPILAQASIEMGNSGTIGR